MTSQTPKEKTEIHYLQFDNDSWPVFNNTNNVLYLDFDAKINTGIQDNPTEEPMASYLSTNHLRENRLPGYLIPESHSGIQSSQSTHSLCGGHCVAD